MNAQLQVYVAKPVYSDQLKNKKQQQNTMALVLEPDWHSTRLQSTRPSSGPRLLLALETRMDGCLSWTWESEEDPRGGSEWWPKQAGGLGREGGRRELHPSPKPARRPGLVPLVRPRSVARTPGRVCDCCFAAFLTGRPLLTGPQLRAANPGLVSLLSRGGQFRVALLRQHPARRRVPAR